MSNHSHSPKNPFLANYDWIHKEYEVKNRTAIDIAKELGVSAESVARALRYHKIPTRRYTKATRDPLFDDREALNAEVQVKPLRQIGEEHNYSYSGVLYAVRKHDITVPHRFSHRPSPTKSENIKRALKQKYPNGRHGAEAPNWKGGRRQVAGYWWIYMPEHPRARAAGRAHVQEHIVIMEKKLGRYLTPGEEVDHLDNDKGNNDPDNLEIRGSRSAHQKRHWRDAKDNGKEAARLRALLIANGIDPDGVR